MESRQEIIDFGSRIPVKFFLHRIGNVPRHWHDSMELLFVLSGSAQAVVDDAVFTLGEDDVLLVNADSMHALQADACVLAAFQIRLDMFDPNLIDAENAYFTCNSVLAPDPPRYAPLKRLMAMLLKHNAIRSPDIELYNKALSYELLYVLMTGFRAERRAAAWQSARHLDRLTRIIDGIQASYAGEITLSGTARREYLSTAYLSRFFERHMGMTFLHYVQTVRISHAVGDLTQTSLSIEAIAARNGFSSPRAFVSAFRKEYGVLPSVYRQNRERMPDPATRASGRGMNYLDYRPQDALAKLAQYLEEPVVPMVVSTTEPEYHVDIRQPGSPLPSSFRTFLGVGRARDFLDAGVQDMLRRVQREVGFRHVKFHNILGDDMLVYSERPDGTPDYAFLYVDRAMDFLLSVGLRPLVQLSFMPQRLAAQPERTLFHPPMHMSPPRDRQAWIALVRALVRHLITRYGPEEVARWPFCVWNEPDTPQSMFGFSTPQAFFDFYRDTWHAVKDCHAGIAFGTPSLLPLSADNPVWAESFPAFCRLHGCEPDFINLHYYECAFPPPAEFNKHFDMPTQPPLQAAADGFSRFANRSRALAQAQGWGDRPRYVTEWNHTTSHRDWLNDTAWKAAYVARTVVQNLDAVDSFGYWCLTDRIEEHPISPDLFHGGLGLFTQTGIPKPGYHAFRFLARLGDELVERGEGYCITRRRGHGGHGQMAVVLLLWHYLHYDDLYAAGERFDMTRLNRYTPFPPAGSKSVSFALSGWTGATVHVRETWVNRQAGSVFDQWVVMGAQPVRDALDHAALEAASHPGCRRTVLPVSNGRCRYEATLEPHEVRLVELVADGADEADQFI